MTVKRIFALICIYALAAAAWMTLGTVTAERSNHFNRYLGETVEGLWGEPLVQGAPSLAVEIPGSERVRWTAPSKNDIRVDLNLDYRRKGLIWYPTYRCVFTGDYTLTNTEEVTQKIRLCFDLPVPDGTYDRFEAALGEERILSPTDGTGEIRRIVELQPGGSRVFHVEYETRGMYEWRYRQDDHVGSFQNLNLAVYTDFADVDYPDDGLSPTSAGPPEPADAEPAEKGDAEPPKEMKIVWKADNMLTRKDIGVVIPEVLNPGPLASRITFFAPVCLVFFFVLVATISIVRRISIHPMHYLFVAAGFFAFHLLLAYLVDHIPVQAAFAISAVVSVALVTCYLSAAVGKQLPWRIAAGGQIFFLVLFSYSFFLEGMTGLTVALGSVVTLAILMKITSHVDWDEVFARKARA